MNTFISDRPHALAHQHQPGMRIPLAQVARHRRRVLGHHRRTGEMPAIRRVAEAALVGGEHRYPRRREIRRRDLPRIAAVVHPVQRQHHGRRLTIRQPPPIRQLCAIRHREHTVHRPGLGHRRHHRPGPHHRPRIHTADQRQRP
jgi:hypothetical protein